MEARALRGRAGRSHSPPKDNWAAPHASLRETLRPLGARISTRRRSGSVKTRHEHEAEIERLRDLRRSMTILFFVLIGYAGFILALIHFLKATPSPIQ